MKSKSINPYQAYTVEETAVLIGIHPMSLRRKLIQHSDPFVTNAQPVKIGKEWRFMGENILRALGSVSYSGELHQIVSTGNAGVPELK